jgi:hypothetical protein
MKPANPNQTGQRVTEANAPQTRYGSRPLVDADTAIKEIHQRAEHVGSVLEEILQTGHKRANSDKSV